MSRDQELMDRMALQIDSWEGCRDGRCVFLRTYLMMTRTILKAAEERRFHDSQWLCDLLHHFAGYYFNAVAAYDGKLETLPAVWKRTHDLALARTTTVMEDFLLGLNAHVNYDLPMSLVDLMGEQWAEMSEEQRRMRYEDFMMINGLIAGMTDAVQAELADRYARVLGWLDLMGGAVDEWSTGHILTAWRDDVWGDTIRLIEAQDRLDRERIRQEIDAYAVGRAELLFVGEGLRRQVFAYPLKTLRSMNLL